MSNSKSRPSQIWDQWLQRLHGIEDPQKNYYRLEFLELLTKYGPQENGRFFHRLGTVLARSLEAENIFIVEQASQKILFPSIDQKSNLEKPLASRLPKTLGALTIKYYPRPVRFGKQADECARTVALLPISLNDDRPVCLVVLAKGALGQADRRFLYFIAGVINFIEGRNDLSRRLIREQRLVQSLTQNLNEGLALMDGEMKISIWNRPLQRITGFSPKETQGVPYEQALKLKDRPDWLGELSEAHENSGQAGFFTEGEVITKNKQARWVAISGSFLRNESGKIEQTIALIRDISHIKALELRKNEFISIATHELRTPITAVKGYLSLLKKEADSLSPKQQSYLGQASQATERLVKLAEDLLQVIRLDEDRMKFSLQPLELAKVIEKVGSDLSEKARSKSLEFHMSLPPFNTTVIGDPLRMEQALANLVDNAIKYTTEGSISIGFEHFSEKLTGEEKVTVVIKDTGIGIDNKDLAGIFDKFHRSDKAAFSREPGAGLGLYIVKSFIEKQGGSISVKSRVRRGSSFAVTFPTVTMVERKVPLAERKNTSTI